MAEPSRPHPCLGRVVVVVPTYNEADNLAWIVGRLRAAQPDVDVLIVDDDSPDGTGGIADRLAAADAAVHVLHRTEKGGLGAAYRHGFAHALSQGFDVVGEMDADGSHQPEQLDRLLAALADGADLVIGSRWVAGGTVVNWPRRRMLLSRGGNLYVRLLLGVPVRDATAGYRLFRRSALEKILDSVSTTGYVFQTDLVARCLHAGLTVREVPIEFVERERGQSKMSPRIALDSLVLITRWGVQQRRAQAARVWSDRRGRLAGRDGRP